MNNKITVDEAIKRATWYITFSTVLILFGIIIISLSCFIYFDINNWKIMLVFISAFGLSLIWQKYATIKWQFWAFENVRNVHELKKVAIQNEIFKPNKSIFDQSKKFNIKHKVKLDQLKAKFELEDEFYEDINITFETKIFYNKIKIFLFFIFYLFVFGILGSLSIKENLTIILFISFIFLIISLFYLSKFYNNNKPRIVINNNGMSTFKTPFYEWNEIKNEEVVIVRYGTNFYYYLIYNHPKGKEQLNIGNFNVNNRKLNKLLMIYRGRNNKSNNL
jgi:hypothetical protein